MQGLSRVRFLGVPLEERLRVVDDVLMVELNCELHSDNECSPELSQHEERKDASAPLVELQQQKPVPLKPRIMMQYTSSVDRRMCLKMISDFVSERTRPQRQSKTSTADSTTQTDFDMEKYQLDQLTELRRFREQIRRQKSVT